MDLYIVLGIAREASDADIKRAYRRLARQLHPDINPGDREAAVRFRQVLHAYETLIDPNLRRTYDSGELGATPTAANAVGFAGFDFSAAATAQPTTTFGDLFEDVFNRHGRPTLAGDRGADLHIKATLPFEASLRGASWPITVTRHDTCRACAGTGTHRTAESRCLACEGTGAVRSVRGHMVFAKTCRECGGAGRRRHATCETCQGQGVERRVEALTVNLPAGIASGARVRLAGKGHAGVRGAPSGDLYVDVVVQPHPVFTRVGDDLHVVVPIAIDEAGLGARIAVETPDGPARLRIPPGTQTGQRFRMRERGMPSVRGGPRGDLLVEVQLMLPKLLDERSKELLREFGRLNAASVRERPGETAPADGQDAELMAQERMSDG
jgi:molecular chaperone DnaJ